MTVKIRLARHGAKKKPFYWIVAAHSRSPRDGKFLEKLGTFNPLLSDDHAEKLVMKKDRAEYWLNSGAQPTEKALLLLKKAAIQVPTKIIEKAAKAPQVAKPPRKQQQAS